MKTEQPLLITSIEAAEDIQKGLMVNIDGSISQGDGAYLGVCAADTYSGEQCPVVVAGIALVKNNGAITAGHLVKTQDDGFISDCGISIAEFYNFIVGTALDSAPGDESIFIRVKLL